MQKEPKFLTIAQAAEFLKVSPDTLRRWEDKGIVSPQRTKGGSRRYTLLDLKIAKLNKRKTLVFQIPTLISQNYISSKKDLKVAVVTSFLWIFGLLAYHFLTPVFLQPTNPDRQVMPVELKEQNRLRVVSQTTENQINAFKMTVPAPTANVHLPGGAEVVPGEHLEGVASLLISSLPALEYSDTLGQYYSLKPLPQKDIPTLIKRNLTP